MNNVTMVIVAFRESAVRAPPTPDAVLSAWRRDRHRERDIAANNDEDGGGERGRAKRRTFTRRSGGAAEERESASDTWRVRARRPTNRLLKIFTDSRVRRGEGRGERSEKKIRGGERERALAPDATVLIWPSERDDSEATSRRERVDPGGDLADARELGFISGSVAFRRWRWRVAEHADPREFSRASLACARLSPAGAGRDRARATTLRSPLDGLRFERTAGGAPFGGKALKIETPR